MSKRMTRDDLPTSLGAFKPVDHVMLAVADDDQAERTTQALYEAGFGERDVLRFSPHEGGADMARMIEKSSDFAGFGYEITLMRRYLELAREGYQWLLVYAPNDGLATRVREVAEQAGLPMAVRYHLLAVEDLV
jgi:hypothetical protein